MYFYTNSKSKKMFDMMIEKKIFQRAYQPIIHIFPSHLIGYEALLRCDVCTPEVLFYRAKQTERQFELDTASIYKSLSTFFMDNKERYNQLLFVNVLSSTIFHPYFLSFVDQYANHIPKRKVIFEINETDSIGTIGLFRNTISYLRKRGFRIALDDVGAGASSILKMIELEPDIIKLDRYLAKNLSHSKAKQRVVEMFVHYCQDDLEMEKQSGVRAGQGFLLGKPAIHIRGSTQVK